VWQGGIVRVPEGCTLKVIRGPWRLHEGLGRVGENCPFGASRSPQRALPAETKVESGTSRSKSKTSVNLSNSGEQCEGHRDIDIERDRERETERETVKETERERQRETERET